jgi:DNA polymerase III delta prime subunit
MKKINFKTFRTTRKPRVLFNDMTNLVDMVASGINPSLVISGAPGLGKTFLTVKQLQEKGLKNGIDFIHVKGRSTAAGMFITLYENSNKLIIFDDCDSVFKDKDAINLLKGALDSYDKRTISWLAAKPLKDEDGENLPRFFDFEGKIIFITNVSSSKIDPAIKSRSFIIDIDLNADQMLARMKDLLPEIEPGVDSLKLKRDALNALRAINKKYDNVQLNFRSLIKAIRIRQMGFKNWKNMVAEQVVGE